MALEYSFGASNTTPYLWEMDHGSILERFTIADTLLALRGLVTLASVSAKVLIKSFVEAPKSDSRTME